MIGVLFVYSGLIAMAAGAVSLLKPLRFLGIRTRRTVAGGAVKLLAMRRSPARCGRAAKRK